MIWKSFDAVQEEVHAGDARGDEVALLPVELERAVLAAAALHLDQRRDEHAAGAAGGVVDRFAGLGREQLRHQVDDGAVGVELGGGVAGVVGELLDQEFVGVAEFVLGHVGDRQRLGREVLDQVLERRVGQALAVGPRANRRRCRRAGPGWRPPVGAARSGWPADILRLSGGHRSSARLPGSGSGGSRRTRHRRDRHRNSASAAWYSSSQTSETRLKKSSGKMNCL
jgi:hypothetical protein